jgi:CHAD domain-containing protein
MAKARKIKGIDCRGTAVIGIQQVLIQRFDEMCDFRMQALDVKDPEGVHSMRVASRRLRSALRSFLPHLNERALAPVIKQIKVVADTLGEVRDQDVAIQALEELLPEIPKRFAHALQQLIEARKENREAERANLQKLLGKTRLKQLRAEFQSAITQQQPAPTSPADLPSYVDVAREIINNRLTGLEQLSKSLYYPDQVQPLHDMRIAAKRLRYAIELFAECWDTDIGPFAKNAALLQTYLGQLHDCDVWIEDFRKKISACRKSGNHDQAETFVWLFTYYQEQRNKYYREAFFCWSSWQADELSSKLKEMLQPEDARAMNSSGSASASSSLSK